MSSRHRTAARVSRSKSSRKAGRWRRHDEDGLRSSVDDRLHAVDHARMQSPPMPQVEHAFPLEILRPETSFGKAVAQHHDILPGDRHQFLDIALGEIIVVVESQRIALRLCGCGRRDGAASSRRMSFFMVRYFIRFPSKSMSRSNGCSASSVIRAASRRVRGLRTVGQRRGSAGLAEHGGRRPPR